MKDFFLQVLNLLGLAHWVKIGTETPLCTYYFGPFVSKSEAEGSKNGYLEDLNAELAQGIQVEIKRCKPSILTIFDEVGEEFRPFRQTYKAF